MNWHPVSMPTVSLRDDRRRHRRGVDAGYMNRQALAKTLDTGEAHYWSRSRQAVWRKGATVHELRIDDDQDSIRLRVRAPGPAPVAMSATCPASIAGCLWPPNAHMVAH